VEEMIQNRLEERAGGKKEAPGLMRRAVAGELLPG